MDLIKYQWGKWCHQLIHNSKIIPFRLEILDLNRLEDKAQENRVPEIAFKVAQKNPKEPLKVGMLSHILKKVKDSCRIIQVQKDGEAKKLCINQEVR